MKRIFLFTLIAFAVGIVSFTTKPTTVQSPPACDLTAPSIQQNIQTFRSQFGITEPINQYPGPPPVAPNEIWRKRLWSVAWSDGNCCGTITFYRRSFLGIQYGEVYYEEETVGCN